MRSNVIAGLARTLLVAGSLASAVLLASCGGGGAVQTYFATRVIAFGDETSVITANGNKYSVNGLQSGSASIIDCVQSPIWIQTLATFYGLVFPQCPNGVAEPNSRIRAFPGALVADLSGQIDAQINESGLGNGDMATVLIGPNDVIQQWQQYPGLSEAEITANLVIAGHQLADQVSRLTTTGARVIVSTIPDMGLMPFAGDRTVDSIDGNPPLLSRLSKAFNDAFLDRLPNDGHKIGLMQADEVLATIDTQTRAGTGSFTNVLQPACLVALPNCTTNTLTGDAITGNWLWADSSHLSATGQATIGSLAVQRAQNNPF